MVVLNQSKQMAGFSFVPCTDLNRQMFPLLFHLGIALASLFLLIILNLRYTLQGKILFKIKNPVLGSSGHNVDGALCVFFFVVL